MSLVNTATGEIVAHGEGRQVMPPLTIAERAALRDSIVSFGVLVPIIVDQHGNIIDGHNRSEIAEHEGLPCPSETVVVRDEHHAIEIATSLNLDRRHLDAVTRKQLARSLRGQGHSLRAIAGALGVAPNTVRSDVGEPEYQVCNDCTPDIEPDETPEQRVTGTDGKSYPSKAQRWTDDALRNLLALYVGGMSQSVLSEMHDVGQGRISSLLTQARALPDGDDFTMANPPKPGDMHRIATGARRRIAAEMAADNYTSRQIAERLGLSRDGLALLIRTEGIVVPADAVVGSNTRRIDSDRIVNETVTGLEGYCLGLSLVDCEQLDSDQVTAWSESLRSSIKTLNRFLKEMTK